jgi:hypothetical protein
MIPSPMNQSSLECLVKNWRYRHRWLRSFHCSPGYIWFPYKGSNHKSVTDEAKAVTKDQRGTCVVEPSDHRPRVSQIVHTR